MKKQNGMEKLVEVVRILRSENGHAWDREQTHESLKPEVIEEAVEVIGGIDILSRTGDFTNLEEELGDLLLQVVFHAQIAEEEHQFDLNDIAQKAADKMIDRHPDVFHHPLLDESGNPVTGWEEIKKYEKAGREWEKDYLPEAFEEAEDLLEKARKRKGIHAKGSQ